MSQASLHGKEHTFKTILEVRKCPMMFKLSEQSLIENLYDYNTMMRTIYIYINENVVKYFKHKAYILFILYLIYSNIGLDLVEYEIG